MITSDELTRFEHKLEETCNRFRLESVHPILFIRVEAAVWRVVQEVLDPRDFPSKVVVSFDEVNQSLSISFDLDFLSRLNFARDNEKTQR